MILNTMFAILLSAVSVYSNASTLGEWCGSRQHGDLNNLIPDSFRPDRVTMAIALCGYIPGGPSADFRPSCRDHDQCYWRFGTDKKVCDSQFRQSLEQSCRETYNQSHRKKHKSCCLKAAGMYELAVERMGGDSYRAAQVEGKQAFDFFMSLSGRYPNNSEKNQIAELCMIHNNANGSCYIEHVVRLVLDSQFAQR